MARQVSTKWWKSEEISPSISFTFALVGHGGVSTWHQQEWPRQCETGLLSAPLPATHNPLPLPSGYSGKLSLHPSLSLNEVKWGGAQGWRLLISYFLLTAFPSLFQFPTPLQTFPSAIKYWGLNLGPRVNFNIKTSFSQYLPSIFEVQGVVGVAVFLKNSLK